MDRREGLGGTRAEVRRVIGAELNVVQGRPRGAPLWAAVLLPAALLASACTEAGAPVAQAPAAPVAPAATDGGAPAAAPPPAPARDPWLKAGPTFKFVSGELVQPAGLKALEAAAPSALGRVRLVPRAGAQLFGVLDQQVPRPIAPAGRTVAGLLNEDLELSPGAHRLVLFAAPQQADLNTAEPAAPQELVFQRIEFSGGTDAAPAESPGCTLLLPLGTLHGDEGAAVLLLALPTDAGVTSVIYELVRQGQSERLEVPSGQGAVARSLLSGDYQVSATCVGKQSSAPEARLFTVNRDSSSGLVE